MPHQKKLRIGLIAAIATIAPLTLASIIGQPKNDSQNTDSSSSTIATVGNIPISMKAYDHRMQYLSGVGTVEADRLIKMPPGLITLDRMITEYLIRILARHEGVSPTEDQIQQQYRDALSQNPNLVSDYTSTGRTLPDLMSQFKLKVAKFNILTRGVIVTNQEVDQQYTSHPELFTIPKLVHLRIIVVDSDVAKAKVDKELAAGVPFSKVATQESQDITKIRGGDYGNVPQASLSTDFKNALTGVKIGQTTDWFSGQGDQSNLSIKLYFENATPPKKLPLTDALKSQIRRQLMLQKGSVLHDIQHELDALRATEKITINNPVFEKAYKDLLKQEESASHANSSSDTSNGS